MHLDVLEIMRFYQMPIGRIVEAAIGTAILGLHRPGPSDRVAGLGFAAPYLAPWRTLAERTLALMPAPQGAAPWPDEGASAVALVDGERLPFSDGSLDALLLVHALEHARDPALLVREALRVLVPTGRLLVVAPNRRGAWARSDASPFGFGRPFSSGQMGRLLSAEGFRVEHTRMALHAPPFLKQARPAAFQAIERLGRRCWPMLGGVVIAAARPDLADLVPVRLRPRPASMPLNGLAPRPGLAAGVRPAGLLAVSPTRQPLRGSRGSPGRRTRATDR